MLICLVLVLAGQLCILPAGAVARQEIEVMFGAVYFYQTAV